MGHDPWTADESRKGLSLRSGLDDRCGLTSESTIRVPAGGGSFDGHDAEVTRRPRPSYQSPRFQCRDDACHGRRCHELDARGIFDTVVQAGEALLAMIAECGVIAVMENDAASVLDM